MSASSPMEAVAFPSPETFVAADVGGTHVRLALVCESADARKPVTVLDYRKYRCADYPSLAEIMVAYFAEVGCAPVKRGVIASAGYALEDGSVITANLPWLLAPEQIRRQLGMQALHLVNDFEAVAYAANYMACNQVMQLSGPPQGAPGPALVLGPGTGLGAALWIPNGANPVVLPTEAGHAALAAASDLEVALLQELRRTRTHVATEHLLSGPGLLNLYTALAALRGEPAIRTSPADVTTAALAGNDVLARDALQAFCGFMGSVVGDLMLLYGVRSGVYLAGGFLPQIATFIAGSDFVARLLDKGALRPALEQVPVSIVEHGQLGVIGAASWFLQHGR
ncbi:glucokinase family protein [Xanthomonas fragariae]|uniref:Glucokinase n=2 Tax=Xanthomonas fragariae TaxID=48664 RepID=A0A1Y6H9A9_9XANT|nr:glucokinase family protein [Xanthomonas fragariae]AOD15585.1 glucokinase [Xanthomonas fragariae]AOD18995.1 glucokinase [Xanthomonas fragariae]ENZ93835.1 glucokinase [Xanthomonas fragariae LMG 25863]MDM7555171.1 glucokinase family protein [Xanthomonas fragariae]MDM7558289.1 glucokinase family protein [Xanthomonas fragariae]